MWHRGVLLGFISWIYLGGFFYAHALEIPERPQGYVSDLARLLSPEAKSKIENQLRLVEEKTTNQIIVVTIPSLDGEAIEVFSIRLAVKWRIGQKGRDNGVIFLIVKEAHQMRIEVGYGLEGRLPDALAHLIMERVVAPHFKKGNYDQGIIEGIQAIAQATEGEYTVKKSRKDKFLIFYITILLLTLLIFFMIDILRYRQYLHDYRIFVERYTFWQWWVRFTILSFAIHLFFRLFIFVLLFRLGGGFYSTRSGVRGFSGGGGRFGGGGAIGRW